MTNIPFIQKWTQKTIPDRIKKLLPNYNNEDIIFIPHSTKQKFNIKGSHKLEYIEINTYINGSYYTITPGLIFKCEKLEITLDDKSNELSTGENTNDTFR